MKSALLTAYRHATKAFTPAVFLYLHLRRVRGKEDAERFPERFGYASVPRPAGRLIWLHAASVGEANSVQPLIEALSRHWPEVSLLLTTGTVTSAKLMRERLPHGVIHQFVPVDVPAATERFIRYWKPDVALFVESELWPNLLASAHAGGCRMALLNARMSDKSFLTWQRFAMLARTILGWFNAVYAQSEEDAVRFSALGALKVEPLGNLKFDGVPLAADAEALVALERAAGDRPKWLAASIHPKEDAMIAGAHRILKQTFPQLLTVVVPRHPQRGAMMREVFAQAGCTVAQRSVGEMIVEGTDVYIADTMGELGLFYRLCPLSFIGGSLIAHGGQNPLEPARLGCAILFGPYMFNFMDIASGLKTAGAARQVENAQTLADSLRVLLKDPQLLAGMASRASAYVIGKAGVNERVLSRLAPLIEEASRHAA